MITYNILFILFVISIYSILCVIHTINEYNNIFFISSNLILRKDKIFIFVDNDERLERPGFIGSVNHQVYQQESKRQYIL